MTSSKPTTPVGLRRQFAGEAETTRIPILSPQPFRRSYSMRLRYSTGTYYNDYQHFGSHYNNANMEQKQRIVCGDGKIKNSKSNSTNDLTKDGTHNKVQPLNGILTNKSGNQQNQQSNARNKISSSTKTDRGMSLNLNGSGQNTSTLRSPRTPQTPKTPSSGFNLTKSSLSPKTPPGTPDSLGYRDDDLDSLNSYSSSVVSGMSIGDNSYFARNGTTFSGRKMKYVVHCSNYGGQTGDDYLTPTQRAQRQIRRLKELLSQARVDLEHRDSEILRLTKEVVELRLFKASLSSPDERSNSSDAVTVRENTTNELHTPDSTQDISPITLDPCSSKSPRHQLHNHGIHQVQFMDKMCSSNSEMQSSFADSGHFEDITTSSIHSKDSYIATQDRACGSDDDIDIEKQQLIEMYEKRIEELIKQHDTDKNEIKNSHNDKVEALLQKLADCNNRYCDLVPDHEQAKEKIRELEKQLDALHEQLQGQENKTNKMYLEMYVKDQEAEKIKNTVNMSESLQKPRVSVPELMQQLQVTQDELENIRDTKYQQESGNSKALLSAKEAISLWLLGARKTMYKRVIDAQQTKNKIDPEVTLQFLKSAIYYFLTDKENSQGHLNAIESILGFTDVEKSNISRARSN